MKFLSTVFLTISMLIGMNSDAHSIEVQGHRGARGLYPENTLPAFKSAIEAGTNTLELDLHITQDGEVIIHHDYFIQEGFDAQSLIRCLELAELKKVDCGSKTNPNFPRQQSVPGAQIPTLDELFALINHSSHPNAKTVRLNLEIKRDPRYPELTINAHELATKIVSKVQQAGFSKRVYYSSFDPDVLSEIHELDPEAELGFIFSADSLAIAKKLSPENPMGLMIHLAKSFNTKVLSPEHVLLTDAKIVQAMHQAGFRVVPWTVNDSEDWSKYIEMGVDGIITDYPQDLLHFLNNVN